MAQKLHSFAEGLQEQLTQHIPFFTRLRIVLTLLPIYFYLAFYDTVCLLLFPTHKSFTYFNSLNPQKGYTGSYVRHARRKRKIRFGLVSLTAILIVQTVLFGLFTPPELARAATCSIGADTTVDQTYIDLNACQDIHITGNATITFTGAIDLSGTGIFYVDNLVTATFNGAFNLSDVNDTLQVNGKITHANGNSIGINITAPTVVVSVTGSIDVSSKGCQPDAGGANGQGPDGTNTCTISTAGFGSGNNGSPKGGGGAGYGGGGGSGSTQPPSTPYGSSFAPTLQGSSGGSAGTTAKGGAGGGLIQMTVAGTLTVDGSIKADGGAGSINSTNQAGGGGSGGGINITAGTLAGSGLLFSARGGNGAHATQPQDGGGGGGGRIAVVFTSGSPVLSSANFTESGGTASGAAFPGQQGTGYVKKGTSPTATIGIFNGFQFDDTDFNESRFTIDPGAFNLYCAPGTTTPSITAGTVNLAGMLNCITPTVTSFNVSATSTFTLADFTTWGVVAAKANMDWNLPAGASYTWNNVNLNGGAEALFTIDDAVSITLAGTTSVKANPKWTNLNNLTINNTAGINVTGLGCRGISGSNGTGPNGSNSCIGGNGGAGIGANNSGGKGGGGHGGGGGTGAGGATGPGGPTYDTSYLPALFGSSGGGASGQSGGNGGGLIRLDVTGTLTIDGSLNVSGGNGKTDTTNNSGGAGSGGSIYITTATLNGTPTSLMANGGTGGNGSSNDGGGGGGGMIAIAYTGGAFTHTSATFSVFGGLGPDAAAEGVQGTVFVKFGSSPTATDTVYYGFGYDDTDFNEGTFTMDSSAINQHCTSTAATPSITAATLNIAGTIMCNPGTLTSFNLSASTAFTIASGTTMNVGTKGATVDLNIPAGYDQTWTNFVFTGGAQGDFTMDDAVAVTLAGTTSITGNVNFSNMTGFTQPGGTNISADQKGCYATGDANGSGPNGSNVCITSVGGFGTGTNGATGAGGGGYGGTGGKGSIVAGGSTTGSSTAPILFGSSGGNATATDLGGTGGGRVRLNSTGNMTLNGSISANGGNGITDGVNQASGGGSGGAIYASASGALTLSTGAFTANGGNGAAGSGNKGGGGGAGRIAITYGSGTPSISSAVVNLNGGTATSTAVPGAQGTGFVQKGSFPTADVTIYRGFGYDETDYVVNSWTEDASAINQYCELSAATPSITAATVSLNGSTSCDAGSLTSFNISATSNFAVATGSSFSVKALGAIVDFNFPAGNNQTWTSFTFNGPAQGNFTIDDAIAITLNSTNINSNVNWKKTTAVTIDGTSSINANGKGCAPTGNADGSGPNGSNVCSTSTGGFGPGLNGGTGAGGGGYGGAGGAGNLLAGGATYGSSTQPKLFGSTGGNSTGARLGGAGGGAVRVDTSGTLTVNGNLSAGGSNGSTNGTDQASGGGSGGSVYLTAVTLAGTTGAIAVPGGNGAAGSSNKGGGGGGGRVSIGYLTDNSTWRAGLTDAGVAPGGTATSTAVAGTTGTLNSQVFTAPATPSITSPTDGATAQSRTLTVNSSAYSSDGLSQTATDWQISDDNTFSNNDCSDSNIVFCSMNSSQFTSIAVDPLNGSMQNALNTLTQLAPSTLYYVRVRYVNGAGFSSWSTPVSFTTQANSNPSTPTNSTPADLATGVSKNPNLSASAYSDPDNDPLVSGDWRVYEASDCSGTADWTSALPGGVTVNIGNGTFADALAGRTELKSHTTYSFKVRYLDVYSGASSYSTCTQFTTTNTAPTFSGPIGDQTFYEDTSVPNAFDLDTYFSDPDFNDDDQYTCIATNGFSAGLGTMTVNGDHTVSFSFAANANGSDSVQFSCVDGGGLSDVSNTITVTLTAVNDVPSFTKGADQTVNEDAGLQSVGGWATAISKGPANESSQTLTFTATNDNNGLFSSQPSVDTTTGNLAYTPAANVNGSTTVTVHLADNGGTSNGGDDTSDDQTFTITVNSVNDAPSFTKGGDQTVNEDAGLQSVGGWATAISKGPSNESAQTLTFTATNDNNGLFSSQPSVDTVTGNLAYTPAANANGITTVTVHLADNGGVANGGVDTSADQTFTITVNSVNDVPSFTKGGDQTVNEDVGAQTATGWATAISKGPSNESAQTLTFTATNDNNGLFSVQPSVNTATGNLTYTPAANVNGSTTVTVHLADNGGVANGGVDTSADQTFTITVNSVNDVPSFTKGGDITVSEDEALSFSYVEWATLISAGASNESSQVLTFNVSTDNDGLFSSAPVVYPASGDLGFAIAPNANGVATVTLSLSDDGGVANGGVDISADQTFTITVNSVNDVPSFTKGGDQTVNEDAGAQTAIGWATSISKGPSNESAQTLTFTATNDNNGLFSSQPTVNTTTGTLTYTPAANANGSTIVTVHLSDDGGVANGGVDTSADQTFTITVSSVNDAPTFVKGADQDVADDVGSTTIAGWATSISRGSSNESAQTLTFGTSTTNDSIFSVLPAVNTSTGTLTYTPALNVSGTATVTVTLSDNGGTANGGVNSSNQTFTVTVTAVNEAPSFTKGADQTVNEDVGSTTVAGWATSISKGPAGESSQTLTFHVSTNNDSLFSVLPSVNTSTGDLTYTSAANANGSATVTVNLSDNGGTANGGSDTSADQTFTITVNSVNDAPTYTKGSNQTVNEDAGGQTVAGWATSISKGPANESGQVLSFGVATNNDSLFSSLPVVNVVTGNLTYTPAANISGSATVTLTLSDDGGTANGGVSSSAQTFTITVNSVNDVPSFTKGADQTVNEDVGLQSVGGWATAISKGPSNESAQTLTFTATNDNNGLFSSQPSVDTVTGNLAYTPAANANGITTVTVHLADNGGTANGGDDTSDDQTFTITVNSVNDVPSFTKGADQTVNEDAGAQTATGWATAISKGPANESAQTLTFTVTNDNNSLFSTQPAISSSGTLTFTSGANENGFATVTVHLSDNGGTANGGVDTSADQTFVITVTGVNDGPHAYADQDQTVNEDDLTATLDGSGSTDIDNTLTYAWAEITDSTDGCSLDSFTGATPTVTIGNKDSSYSCIFRLTVSDGTAEDTDDVTVNVVANNDAPAVTEIADKSVDEGSNLTFSFVGTDVDTQLLILSVTDESGFVAHDVSVSEFFTQEDNNVGTFSWTPGYLNSGNYQLRMHATDGSTDTSRIVNIGVNEIDDPADFNGSLPNVSFPAGTTTNTLFNLHDYFSDEDANTYSVSGNDSVTIQIDNGEVTMSAPADFSGTEDIRFTATDTFGAQRQSNVVTVSVDEVVVDQNIDHITGDTKGPGEVIVYNKDNEIIAQWEAFPKGGVVPKLGADSGEAYILTIKNTSGTTVHAYTTDGTLLKKKRLSPHLHRRRLDIGNIFGTRGTDEIAIVSRRDHNAYLKIFTFNVETHVFSLYTARTYHPLNVDRFGVRIRRKTVYLRDNKHNVTLTHWTGSSLLH